MHVSEDAEGTAALYQMVRDEYNMNQPRDGGLHGTSLLYCLTKLYYEHTDPLPITDTEVGLFSVGFGLERVLINSKADALPVKWDGISFTPDFWLLGDLADLKTTMMSEGKSLGCVKCGSEWKGHSKAHKYEKNEQKAPFEPPASWAKQFANYAYVMWKTTGELRLQFRAAVLHLMTRTYKSYMYTFTQEELEDQWAQTSSRRDEYLRMLEQQRPEPYGHLGYEGECANCRYSTRCMLSASIGMVSLKERMNNG